MNTINIKLFLFNLFLNLSNSLVVKLCMLFIMKRYNSLKSVQTSVVEESLIEDGLNSFKSLFLAIVNIKLFLLLFLILSCCCAYCLQILNTMNEVIG